MAATMTGRVAIVTGASSGIGEAIATAFGAEGARVVLGGRRVEELQRVAAVIEKAGGQALPLPEICGAKPMCSNCSRRPSALTAGSTCW